MEAIFDYSNWNNSYELFKYKNIESKVCASSIEDENIDVIVAIPAYKRADTIRETIDSVLKQKTKYKYVIMVVDDSGEDLSVEKEVLSMIKRYKNIILYKNGKNLGQAGNWNRCIELAWVKWVVLLHDDDMLCENYLEKVMSVVKTSNVTEVGVFQYKKSMIIDNKAHKFNMRQSFAQKILSIVRNRKPFYVYSQDIFQYILPSPGCWLINRNEIIAKGGFDSNFGVTLDGVFHFRNICNGKVMIIPEFLMIRRIEQNIFLNEKAQIEVINMLYFFCINFLENYRGIKKKYYKFLLDVSTVYLGNGISDKYGGNKEIKNELILYGINKKLVYMPKIIIFFLNCIFLLKLVFRRGISSEI